MRILITGANGFVGRHLAFLCISKGHFVIGFDIHPTQCVPFHQRYTYIPRDILSDDLYASLHYYSPDLIFNLAANVDITCKSPSSFSVNYIPLIALLDYTRSAKCTLVHTSSMLVCQYGSVHDTREFNDNPSTVYGYSKIISEQIIFNHLDKCPDTDVKIARLTSVWGYGMYGPIARLFQNPSFLFTSSSFKGYKTFSYVENCCMDLLALATSRQSPTVTLIGDPRYLTTHEFISNVRKGYQLAGLKTPILIDVPYFLLFFIAIITDLFPFAYRLTRLNTFHLSNYVHSNMVNPLYCPSPVNSPDNEKKRVSFEEGVLSSIRSYQPRP